MKIKYDSEFPPNGECRLNVERREFSYFQHIPERRSGHNRRRSAEANYSKAMPSALILSGYTPKDVQGTVEFLHPI